MLFPQVHRHKVVEMTVEDRGIVDTGQIIMLCGMYLNREAWRR